MEFFGDFVDFPEFFGDFVDFPPDPSFLDLFDFLPFLDLVGMFVGRFEIEGDEVFDGDAEFVFFGADDGILDLSMYG